MSDDADVSFCLPPCCPCSPPPPPPSGPSHWQILRPDVPGPSDLLHGHPVHDHHHWQRHRQRGILCQLHHPREEPPPGTRRRGWAAGSVKGLCDGEGRAVIWFTHFCVSLVSYGTKAEPHSKYEASTQSSRPWARGSSSSGSVHSDLWPLCWRQDEQNLNLSFRG